jgi:methylthioribose-1-phosphate isomerase
MIPETLKWIGGVEGYLELIDQRLLPGEFKKLACRDTEQLWDAIKTLAVRGAPAIGVAAGYGVVLCLQQVDGDMARGLRAIAKGCDYLGSSRPTAVNLFWALDRVKRKAEDFAAANAKASLEQLQAAVLAEAEAICREDKAMCQAIGTHGERFIKEGNGVLTHCNAGALATAGQGTALSAMYEAKKNGKSFSVYADETRPLLQGSRLTAWELQQAGIEVTVICDSMVAVLMRQGKINLVITGADRIAANGDAANKIGTYGVSLLAKAHGIPFYVAAPSSTFDLDIASGDEIPIEQRRADEICSWGTRQTVPTDAGVYNPAFDVTPAENITAIITERGVIERPDTENVRRHLGK